MVHRYIGRSLQGSDTIQSIEMHIMVHSQFCLGLTALTGERLEMFYLFSRLKHLLEYISVYEWTAEVTTAFRTLDVSTVTKSGYFVTDHHWN